MLNAARFFRLKGQTLSCEPYGQGHINRTFLLITDQDAWYILQQINRHVFADVPSLMANIGKVTRHLAKKDPDPRSTLTIVPALDGRDYHQDGEGEYWRAYDFVRGSLCLQQPESAMDFFRSGTAFGRFQRQLEDFPAEGLHETIRNFHNTPDRYRKLHQAISQNPRGRLDSVRQEVDFALAREERAGTLQQVQQSGLIKTRVTHNDTKLNNVLLDEVSREALCVIDLDTVMPGLAAHDFGDSIRFGASTAAEDEVKLDKVTLSLAMYEAYARGFLLECGGSLNREEKETLPEGAWAMTLECGVRFLNDYLMGDTYFRIHREHHNLDRCRTQFKLVCEMEAKWQEMTDLVASAAPN